MIKHFFKNTLEIFGVVKTDELNQKIHCRMIHLIYEQLSGVSLFIESIVAIAMGIILNGSVPHGLLLGWVFYIVLISDLGRQLLRYLYFNNRDKFNDATWIFLFTLGTICSAAGWGCLCLLLMPMDELILQTCVVFVIFGVSAVANNLYAPVLSVYFLFLLLAFSPLTAWFFIQGGAYTILGFMCFPYVAVLVGSAYYNNRLIINSLELGFKNLELSQSEKQLNEQLITASRYAGMADVATSVLHNVGNVLTSVNTSITVLMSKIMLSKMGNLEKIAELLNLHQEDIKTFLINDEKGKRLIPYINTLAKKWSEEKQMLLEEIDSLNDNINHIKEVINNQNNLCMSHGVVQEVKISDLMDHAVKLNQLAFIQIPMEIIKSYSPMSTVRIDRVKLLQILVNLIKNSTESLTEANISNPALTLRIYPENTTCFVIEVMDNGMGIAPENLRQVFHQGFTTKKKGHGFGLHSGAIAAEEMGGKLLVESQGLGLGALFRLKLPFQAKSE